MPGMAAIGSAMPEPGTTKCGWTSMRASRRASATRSRRAGSVRRRRGRRISSRITPPRGTSGREVPGTRQSMPRAAAAERVVGPSAQCAQRQRLAADRLAGRAWRRAARSGPPRRAAAAGAAARAAGSAACGRPRPPAPGGRRRRAPRAARAGGRGRRRGPRSRPGRADGLEGGGQVGAGARPDQLHVEPGLLGRPAGAVADRGDRPARAGASAPRRRAISTNGHGARGEASTSQVSAQLAAFGQAGRAPRASRGVVRRARSAAPG